MQSVAVRTTVPRGQAEPGSTSVRRARYVRRPKTRLRKNARFVALFAALVGVFCYVALYASLTATSFDRSRLADELRIEKIRNERLRVERDRRISPSYAMVAAQKAGMVYAAHYDYLGKSNTMARADQDQDR